MDDIRQEDQAILRAALARRARDDCAREGNTWGQDYWSRVLLNLERKTNEQGQRNLGS